MGSTGRSLLKRDEDTVVDGLGDNCVSGGGGVEVTVEEDPFGLPRKVLDLDWRLPARGLGRYRGAMRDLFRGRGVGRRCGRHRTGPEKGKYRVVGGRGSSRDGGPEARTTGWFTYFRWTSEGVEEVRVCSGRIAPEGTVAKNFNV